MDDNLFRYRCQRSECIPHFESRDCPIENVAHHAMRYEREYREDLCPGPLAQAMRLDFAGAELPLDHRVKITRSVEPLTLPQVGGRLS